MPARLSGRARRALGVLVRVAVVLVAGWWFNRIARGVEWSAVWEAMRLLAVAEVVVLLSTVALRAALNAAPLAILVPSLGLPRAVANDLSANLVATVAPPPSDIVLRVSMLRSWGIDADEGLAGISLNTITYYVARFGAPALGVLLALATGHFDASYVWPAVLGALVSGAVLAGLAVASRGERAAHTVTLWVGTRVHRVIGRGDPQAWATRAAGFVTRVGDVLARGRTRVLACQVGLVLTEALLLLLSLRFVGVPASAVSAAAILVALLVAYPLTALPFAGIGVLDVAVLSMLGLEAGPWESTAVAGIVVFRTCWILVPLAAGALTMLWWRRSTAGSPHAARTDASDKATRGASGDASVLTPPDASEPPHGGHDGQRDPEPHEQQG